MKPIIEALAWAVLILIIAWVAKSNGMNSGTVIGVISGIASAAYISINARHAKRRNCGTGCV